MKRNKHLFLHKFCLGSWRRMFLGRMYLFDRHRIFAARMRLRSGLCRGFYCDEGACLFGEAPPPFITEEPNLPDFNTDGGVPPAGPPVSVDGGVWASDGSAMGDAGPTETITGPDAGAELLPPEEANDAGNPGDVEPSEGEPSEGQ